MVLEAQVADCKGGSFDVAEIVFADGEFGKDFGAENGVNLGGVEHFERVGQGGGGQNLLSPAMFDCGVVRISAGDSGEPFETEIVGGADRCITFAEVNRAGQNEVGDGKIGVGITLGRENHVGNDVDFTGLELAQELAPREIFVGDLQIAFFRNCIHEIDEEAAGLSVFVGMGKRGVSLLDADPDDGAGGCCWLGAYRDGERGDRKDCKADAPQGVAERRRVREKSGEAAGG